MATSSFTFTFDSTLQPRIVSAFATQFNYTQNQLQPVGTETQGQFTVRIIRTYIRDVVAAAEAAAAAKTASDAAIATANSQVIIN